MITRILTYLFIFVQLTAHAKTQIVSSKKSYSPGEVITLTFEGARGSSKDWIAIFPKGQTPKAKVRIPWWVRTNGTQRKKSGILKGSVKCKKRLAKLGQYTAYLMTYEGTNSYKVLAADDFEIIAKTSTKKIYISTKKSYFTREPIKLDFKGAPGKPKDWIAIYARNKGPKANGKILWWVRTTGSKNKKSGIVSGYVKNKKGLDKAGQYTAYLFTTEGTNEYKVVAVQDFEIIKEKINLITGTTDWPTYMYDSKRSGGTSTQVNFPLNAGWCYTAANQPDPAWPAPAVKNVYAGRILKSRVVYDRAYHVVSIDKKVYFSSSADGSVTCLDLESGKMKWKFFSEGPVRLAPTCTGKQIIFGSVDGMIYSLNKDTGKLIWKTRPVKEETQVGGNGHLIRLFPNRSSILIAKETETNKHTGYFCAGLFPIQGVFHGKLDLESGQVENLQPLKRSAQGYLMEKEGRLFTPTGRVAKGEWLDALVRRGGVTTTIRTSINNNFPYSSINNREYSFRGGRNIVAAFSLKTAKKVWEAKVDGDAYSLAIVRGQLLVSTDKGKIYCFSSEKTPLKLTTVKRNKSKRISKSSTDKIQQLLNKHGSQKGYCLILGATRGLKFAKALASISQFTIIIREASQEIAHKAMQNVFNAGLEKRIKIQHGSSLKLPYSDYFFNIVVDLLKTPLTNDSEVRRVLRPEGGTYIKQNGTIYQRPALKGAGDWTHFYGDAGNSACSNDDMNGSKLAMQWFGKPGPRNMVDRHNRTCAPLYKQGRMFVTGNNWFCGVDAYNGTILWERDIPNSRRLSALKGSSNMAAFDDKLLVASGKNCLLLNGQTGKTEHTFKLPGQKGDWCYTAVHQGLLFGSETKAGANSWDYSKHSYSISWRPRQAFICSNNLFTYDLKTKKQAGVYKPGDGVIITPSIAITENLVFLVENRSSRVREIYENSQKEYGDAYDGRKNSQSKAWVIGGHVKLADMSGDKLYLVALNTKDLKVKWRVSLKHLNLQHTLYTIANNKQLLLYGSRTDGSHHYFDIEAYDIKTGKKLWTQSFKPQDQDKTGEHGEITLHGAVVEGYFYLAEKAYDIKTGTQKESWVWNRGGSKCGTISTSKNMMFWRGWYPRFAIIKDKFSGSDFTTSNRPSCWLNTIPAGGLVMMPEGSAGCSCNLEVQSSLVFRPVQ